jgi:hypothetical protein
MNDSTYKPTLCVGADVHLDEIVLRAVDKAFGREVLQRFRVTNNLPGAQSAAATLAKTTMNIGHACHQGSRAWRTLDQDSPNRYTAQNPHRIRAGRSSHWKVGTICGQQPSANPRHGDDDLL